MVFNKYVKSNNYDIDYAIRMGVRPMQTFFDSERDNLPFFRNEMAPDCHNSHNVSLSSSHIPGRWLLALLHAEEVMGIPVSQDVTDNLKKWTFLTLEDETAGFPLCFDVNKMEIIRYTDLHNLRETMHALYALVKWRHDEHAKNLALKIIRTLNRFFDFESGTFNTEDYFEKTNTKIYYSTCEESEGLLFPIHFGRYIGPLVKFWRETGEYEALKQAVRLKDTCFKHILSEDGDYLPEKFGHHTHSTTSMISSLAQLADATGHSEIFNRIDTFFKSGLKKIALPFGWCAENNLRGGADLLGEINNTSDIMETCLIMGKHGYCGYYAMAEQILRAHFLPSQLLDTSFIPEDEDETHTDRYRMASRSVGAFGFATPYGHEDYPGARISFNWDITGGAVNGLCEAYKNCSITENEMITIALLFSKEEKTHSVTDPYRNNGILSVTAREDNLRFKIRIPARASVKEANVPFVINGEWLFPDKILSGETVKITFDFEITDITYKFRENEIVYRWHGGEVVGANNENRRLCWFEKI